MVKKTKVFNDTTAVIELKQGSANVFHLLRSLPAGKSYDIKVDESATYREYWCAVQPDSPTGERVVFSSDDCTEFCKVRIYEDNGKYRWEGTERRGTWRNIAVPTTTETPTAGRDAETPNRGRGAETPTPGRNAETPKWWQQITGAFRKRN